MMTAAVVENHMVSVPSLMDGESVVVMSNAELQRQIQNAVYLNELEWRIKDLDAGNGVRHELIEIGDEEDVQDLAG